MKVLNYGSLNVDYVYSVDHIIVGGETQHSSKLEVFSGGKGLEPVYCTGEGWGAGLSCGNRGNRWRYSVRGL